MQQENTGQKQIVGHAVDTIGDVETVVELEPLRRCRANDSGFCYVGGVCTSSIL